MKTKTYTRSDLATELALKSNISVDRARQIVDNALDLIVNALLKGDRIQFRNFGLFSVVDRKPKIGRNPMHPQSGEYRIPACRAVRFRPGKELFDRLNAGPS